MMLTFEIALFDSHFAHHKRKCRVESDVTVNDNANVYLAFNNIFALLLLSLLLFGKTPGKICQ